MLDECVITRAGAAPVFNEVTGQYVDTPSTVYLGRCRVQSSGVAAANRDAGDQFIIANRVVVAVPVGTTGLAKDDLVTITSAAFNPQILNAEYRVRSIEDKSQATAVRLQCEETP
jgi:hypothetical protein